MERAALLVLRWRSRISAQLGLAGESTGPTVEGQIKRTAVRWLPLVAKVCLHIGFCKFLRRQNDPAQRVQVLPVQLS
jgi:hypothetical protein